MLNIDDELKKIKKILQDTIVLDKIEIVPHYDWGNKVSVKCFQKIDDKIKEVEYSFYIEYYKDRDNYANALYLLHCDYDHGLGGHSYADKYESIEDFKNTNMYQKELLTEYGKNKPVDTPTLFDEIDDEIQTEELTLFDLDNEDINVSSEDNQLSLFDEIDPVDNNVDLEDLLSYGVDDYYKKHFSTGTPLLRVIDEELRKIPKYEEYHNKLIKYLKQHIPFKETHDLCSKETCMYLIGDTIRVNHNRQDKPIFCLSMVQKGLIN